MSDLPGPICDEGYCSVFKSKVCSNCKNNVDDACIKGKRKGGRRRKCFECKHDDMCENKVYVVRAKRCRRCGGLLTSEFGIRNGIGECCLMKEKYEELIRMPDPNQISFDMYENIETAG